MTDLINYCAKARSEDDFLIHGVSIKILFITPACTGSILSANLTDSMLITTARICRSYKKYAMRRGTQLIKKKAQMCKGIWTPYSDPNSRSPNGTTCLCACLYDSILENLRHGPNYAPVAARFILEFPWLFFRKGSAEK